MRECLLLWEGFLQHGGLHAVLAGRLMVLRLAEPCRSMLRHGHLLLQRWLLLLRRGLLLQMLWGRLQV